MIDRELAIISRLCMVLVILLGCHLVLSILSLLILLAEAI